MTLLPIAVGPGAAPVRGARRYRLAGPGVFEALFRAGKRVEGTFLQLVAAPARSIPCGVGYVIGKKALPSAVARNRVRRVLRVAVARARPALESFDVILRLKRGCAGDEIPALAAEARVLLGALLAGTDKGLPR